MATINISPLYNVTSPTIGNVLGTILSVTITDGVKEHVCFGYQLVTKTVYDVTWDVGAAMMGLCSELPAPPTFTGELQDDTLSQAANSIERSAIELSPDKKSWSLGSYDR